MGGSGIAFYVSYIHYKAMYVEYQWKELEKTIPTIPNTQKSPIMRD